MKVFPIFLLFVLSTQAAEYCETEECARLARSMKSMMNESVDPCDDFYEYVCGNYSGEYDSAILGQLYGNIRELGKFMKTIKPNMSDEKVALTVYQKCVSDKSDNLDTFMKPLWDDTDDLTKLIIEITKLNREKGGLFKNDILERKVTGEKGYNIIMSLKATPRSAYKFSFLPLEDVVSRVKFINLTEYFYQLLPEGERWYGALDNTILIEDSFLTIDTKVNELGKAKTKQLLYSEWKEILKEYIEEDRDDFGCIQNNVFNLFPGISTKFLLGNILKEENIKRVATLFKMLQREASSVLKESVWLDGKTKSAMLMELNSMATSIGIPDELRNQTAMYNQLDIKKLSYLELVRNVLIINSQHSFLKYSKNAEITFTGNPFNIDTNYNHLSHRISITSFYIRYPFIDKNLPEWSILASLAHIIGHEIGHLFDSSNFWLNQDSLRPRDIDQDTREEYIRRTTCLAEKYSEFRFPGFEKHLDGRRTLAENFADQFGFQLAYRLFKKLSDSNSQKLRDNSTLDQQFFLRMSTTWCGKRMDSKMIQQADGDTHSPAMFRINGIVSNSPGFAASFGCAKSTAMNPEKKCELF